MRISDWSSDVCSSDLEEAEERRPDKHAGDHLADDLRLAEIFLRGPADGAADEQDHRDLEEKMDAEVGRRIARRRIDRGRSEKRRVGKECVSTGSSGWAPEH